MALYRRGVTVRELGVDEAGWAVRTLADRRERLVPHAPVFWRPAPGQREIHQSYIECLLRQGGARGYGTDRSVLVAAPRGGGWLVDDAATVGWVGGEGQQLWDALAAGAPGAAVRMVCPTYEPERRRFARSFGLRLAESWWLLELAGCGGGNADVRVNLPGAVAVTMAAPPVYAPPGPVLFLTHTSDPVTALPAAITSSAAYGCAAIVVHHHLGDTNLATELDRAGFRRHCDYYDGLLAAPVP